MSITPVARPPIEPQLGGTPGKPRLGCLADDYTGAADVAAALRAQGLRTVLLFGPPAADLSVPDCDAVVVATKTRSVAAADAARVARDVHRWLTRRGMASIYFKYCSTFDSTDRGNIGPVADALLRASGAGLAVVCPASPRQGRTVRHGQLYVGADLLADSPMRHHPLTPMTESSLPRLLGRQSVYDVALVDLAVVRAGPPAVSAALARLAGDGVRYAVVDAVEEDDLHTLAQAVAGAPLITGAAGLAGALGRSIRGASPAADHEPGTLPGGPTLILAGSCSTATREQVAVAAGRYRHHRLDPVTQPDPELLLDAALTWLQDNIAHPEPLLVFSSATPAQQRAARAAAGDDIAGTLEDTLAAVARLGVEQGRRRLIVAGGETSGAVVDRLQVGSVVVGHEQAPGVPWLLTRDEPRLALLLKSGNYGDRDLLVQAATAGPP